MMPDVPGWHGITSRPGERWSCGQLLPGMACCAQAWLTTVPQKGRLCQFLVFPK